MPLFGRSKREDEAANGGSSTAASGLTDFDALLKHFSELPVAQRAAEVLTGISPQLPQGERSAMDTLLGF